MLSIKMPGKSMSISLGTHCDRSMRSMGAQPRETYCGCFAQRLTSNAPGGHAAQSTASQHGAAMGSRITIETGIMRKGEGEEGREERAHREKAE